MNKIRLEQYAERVRELINSATSLDRDAEHFRTNKFLQAALRDASRGLVEVPRGDDGLERWMLENSNGENIALIDSVARFLLLLRGLSLHSDAVPPPTSQ